MCIFGTHTHTHADSDKVRLLYSGMIINFPHFLFFLLRVLIERIKLRASIYFRFIQIEIKKKKKINIIWKIKKEPLTLLHACKIILFCCGNTWCTSVYSKLYGRGKLTKGLTAEFHF